MQTFSEFPGREYFANSEMPRWKGGELRDGQSTSYVQNAMKAVSSTLPGAMGPTTLSVITPLTHVFLWACAAFLLRVCPAWRGGIYTSTDKLQVVRHTRHVCRLYTVRKVSPQESSSWHQGQFWARAIYCASVALQSRRAARLL